MFNSHVVIIPDEELIITSTSVIAISPNESIINL